MLINGLPPEYYFTSMLPGGTYLFGDGSAAAPSISFLADPDTGFYRIGSGQVGFSGNGVLAIQFNVAGIRTPNGTAVAPCYSFSNDSATGVFLGGVNVLGFATAGTERARFDATNLLIGTTTNSGNGIIQLATHSTGAGGIGFGTETAFYRANAGQLAINYVGGATCTLLLQESGANTFFVQTSAGNTVLSSVGGTFAFNTNGVTALSINLAQAATFSSSVDATAFKVGGVAGADFPSGAVTAITVVKGIVTAIS